MKKSDEQQGRAETSASDPDREGWRQTFDGDLRAEDAPESFYLDLPDASTQLHIAKDNSQHLMISILGFGDASQVSGAAAQIARKAMRRL